MFSFTYCGKKHEKMENVYETFPMVITCLVIKNIKLMLMRPLHWSLHVWLSKTLMFMRPFHWSLHVWLSKTLIFIRPFHWSLHVWLSKTLILFIRKERYVGIIVLEKGFDKDNWII